MPHANLLGWVTLALFGTYYAFNPAKAKTRFSNIQYWIYTAGVVAIVPSLYLLYLGYADLEPITAVSSLVVLLGVEMFAVVIFHKEPAPRILPGGALT